MQASELSFPIVFHAENCAVHCGNPTVSSVYLPTPRWHRLKAHPFLAIHTADEYLTTYSIPNTTSSFTFYTFCSSFGITLWPMWLANSKRQPCFYPPQSHAQEGHTELTNLMRNLCFVREHSVFRAVFIQLNCTV